MQLIICIHLSDVIENTCKMKCLVGITKIIIVIPTKRPERNINNPLIHPNLISP